MSIASEITRLNTNAAAVSSAKSAIASAITAKGGTVAVGDGLSDFADDILSIPTTGADVSGVTATAGDVLAGKVIVGANGLEIIGTMPQRNSSDATVNGNTVTVPAGYYGNGISKSVADGIAGVPAATKGAVSNHSVLITPSVTNITGYISGGTKLGPAVGVDASELVSGTYSATTNGTFDVTNHQYVSVNVPSGQGYVDSEIQMTVGYHDLSVQGINFNYLAGFFIFDATPINNTDQWRSGECVIQTIFYDMENFVTTYVWFYGSDVYIKAARFINNPGSIEIVTTSDSITVSIDQNDDYYFDKNGEYFMYPIYKG